VAGWHTTCGEMHIQLIFHTWNPVWIEEPASRSNIY
jgi:hypothetical protein